MTPWEGIAEYYAQMTGATPDVVPSSKAIAHQWHTRPRSSIVTCKGPKCAPGVTYYTTVPNAYTAFTCWCCGSDEHTTPRPVPRPEPAK